MSQIIKYTSFGLLAATLIWFYAIAPYLSFGAQTTIKRSGEVVNLIGTRTGTTTSGVPFATNSATTSQEFAIGNDVGNAVITVFPTLASTTAQGPNLRLSLAGSNDDDCSTASTTAGVLNNIIKSDITWYDLTGNLLNNVSSLTPSMGTSTIAYTPSVGVGKAFTFTGLNSKCLRVDVSASGTVVVIQAVAK